MADKMPAAERKRVEAAVAGVLEALDGKGFDIAQRIGILETCKHCLIREALEGE